MDSYHPRTRSGAALPAGPHSGWRSNSWCGESEEDMRGPPRKGRVLSSDFLVGLVMIFLEENCGYTVIFKH